MFKETIKMSWQNVIHNKMRSFLTILGVLIGVASIIALISMVQGVTKDITSQVMDMGANKVSIQVKGTPIKSGLTVTDLDEITHIKNIKGVSPTITGKTSIVYNGTMLEDVVIQGKNQVHFSNTEDLLKSGRGLYKLDCDNKNKVCLIGNDTVSKFFPTSNPLGKEIKINGMSYTVIGVLQESSGFSSDNNNSSIIIPYTTAMGLLGNGYINSVDIYMNDSILADTTTAEIKSALNTAFNFNEDAFSVFNMQTILDTVKDMTGKMTLMLSGIASIALIVGGIGIMNMMLVSVTERTTEIGLRKALGAEPKTIQWQFLLEALFLSLLGGVLGILFGIGIAFLASLALGTTFAVAGYSIILAIGFSAVIGLVFGYAPARRASKLNPIDALRST